MVGFPDCELCQPGTMRFSARALKGRQPPVPTTVGMTPEGRSPRQRARARNRADHNPIYEMRIAFGTPARTYRLGTGGEAQARDSSSCQVAIGTKAAARDLSESLPYKEDFFCLGQASVCS